MHTAARKSTTFGRSKAPHEGHPSSADHSFNSNSVAPMDKCKAGLPLAIAEQVFAPSFAPIDKFT